jgi:hypothetical protein
MLMITMPVLQLNVNGAAGIAPQTSQDRTIWSSAPLRYDSPDRSGWSG